MSPLSLTFNFSASSLSIVRAFLVFDGEKRYGHCSSLSRIPTGSSMEVSLDEEYCMTYSFFPCAFMMIEHLSASKSSLTFFIAMFSECFTSRVDETRLVR